MVLAAALFACAVLPPLFGAAAEGGDPSAAVQPAMTGASAASSGSASLVTFSCTAPPSYSVSRPDPRTVIVELLGVDTSRLGSFITVDSPVVEGVTVERGGGTGPVPGARLRVRLRAPARARARLAGNDLILELQTDPAVGYAPAPRPAGMAAASAQSATTPANAMLATAPAVVSHADAANLAGSTATGGDIQRPPRPVPEPTSVEKKTAWPDPAQQTETRQPEKEQPRQSQRAGGGALSGQVVDAFGAAIVGATVTASVGGGSGRTATTDGEGKYALTGLAPGRYTVRAAAKGFALYENAEVVVDGGRARQLPIRLEATTEKLEVTVAEGPSGNSLSGLVLRGKDIDSLPVGPGGLEATLRALAVPSTGPGGPQVFVNGFPGGRLPDKSSIREIRINENPFAAEYSQLGFGRVEILTKPGSDDLRFGAFYSFNDESLNSRNPFAQSRAPFQARLFGGSVSGPIVKKRSSFFFDFERQWVDNDALINATVLDPALDAVPFSRSVLTPQRRLSFGPRVDYQLNKNNTLVARLSFNRASAGGAGVGDFSLPSVGYNTSNATQTYQLTETSILSPKAINEIRFQFIHSRLSARGDSSSPTIQVPGAFVGGGSQTGPSSRQDDRWQLQNYTSLSLGKHFFKFGGQAQGVRLADSSQNNFNGTYTFGGGLAPQLDAAGGVVRGADGLPVTTPITGLERYRRTLLFGGRGLSPAEVRDLGGGPTQFSLNAGNPAATARKYDAGLFVQDDWRLRHDLTMSWGLRYEKQNGVKDRLDFAPRLALAWAPDNKTTLRGGVGVFYDRFDEGYVLEAARYDGVSQQQFIVNDPALLNLFPVVPPASSLSAFAVPQSVRRLAADLQAPYSVQASLSAERQLPHGLTLAATFINTRGLHLLRSRDINAPFVQGLANQASAVRPSPGVGEVFQYESSGRFDQRQLALNVVERYRGMMTLWATYILSKASGDTDGAGTFPASSYDLRGEYGRSALDVRHSFYLGGWISAPFGMQFTPLVFYRTGTPFNITTGLDANGDSLFTERPAFATDLARPSVVVTRFGSFDLNPLSGQTIIPRNYGRGAGFFSVNLGVSRTFAFGPEPQSGSSAAARAGGNARRAWGVLPARHYSITLGVQVENLFNHTNPGLPVGNLSSPQFGIPLTSAGAFGIGNNPAGNRRIELQFYINF